MVCVWDCSPHVPFSFLSPLPLFKVLPFDDNVCLREPCQNYMKCISVLRFNSSAPFISSPSILFRPIHPIAGLRCRCPVGFTGDYCETEINLCYSNPCLNGGVCARREGGYTCICREDYTGEWGGESPGWRQRKRCRHSLICGIENSNVSNFRFLFWNGTIIMSMCWFWLLRLVEYALQPQIFHALPTYMVYINWLLFPVQLLQWIIRLYNECVNFNYKLVLRWVAAVVKNMTHCI